MTLINTANELQQSTATLIADSVVAKLFTEIDKFQSKSVDALWFDDLLGVFNFSQSVEIGFLHARSYVLALIKQHWEELPHDIRSKYGFTFSFFAQMVTGKERSTVDSYVNVAKTWFIDKVRPSGDVRISARDMKGKPLTGQYRYVPFNPYSIDMSKLLIVNRRASRGEMSDRLWEMVVDPFFSCEDLARENSSQLLSNGDTPDEYYEALGPGIFFKSGLDSVCICESLNWEEYDSDERVKAGIDRLLKLLDISRDDDVIFNHLKGEYQFNDAE